jgi:hypothetical protein
VDGNWPRSIEFQIREHDMGDLYALGMQITVRARTHENLWLYDPKGEPTVFVQRRPIGNRSVKLEDAEKPRGESNIARVARMFRYAKLFLLASRIRANRLNGLTR